MPGIAMPVEISAASIRIASHARFAAKRSGIVERPPDENGGAVALTDPATGTTVAIYCGSAAFLWILRDSSPNLLSRSRSPVSWCTGTGTDRASALTSTRATWRPSPGSSSSAISGNSGIKEGTGRGHDDAGTCERPPDPRQILDADSRTRLPNTCELIRMTGCSGTSRTRTPDRFRTAMTAFAPKRGRTK